MYWQSLTNAFVESAIPPGSIYFQKILPEYEPSFTSKKVTLYDTKNDIENLNQSLMGCLPEPGDNVELQPCCMNQFIHLRLCFDLLVVIYLQNMGQTLSCARAPLSTVWRWVIRKSLQLSPVLWALLVSAPFPLFARQSYVTSQVRLLMVH